MSFTVPEFEFTMKLQSFDKTTFGKTLFESAL